MVPFGRSLTTVAGDDLVSAVVDLAEFPSPQVPVPGTMKSLRGFLGLHPRLGWHVHIWVFAKASVMPCLRTGGSDLGLLAGRFSPLFIATAAGAAARRCKSLVNELDLACTRGCRPGR